MTYNFDTVGALQTAFKSTDDKSSAAPIYSYVAGKLIDSSIPVSIAAHYSITAQVAATSVPFDSMQHRPRDAAKRSIGMHRNRFVLTSAQ